MPALYHFFIFLIINIISVMKQIDHAMCRIYVHRNAVTKDWISYVTNNNQHVCGDVWNVMTARQLRATLININIAKRANTTMNKNNKTFLFNTHLIVIFILFFYSFERQQCLVKKKLSASYFSSLNARLNQCKRKKKKRTHHDEKEMKERKIF